MLNTQHTQQGENGLMKQFAGYGGPLLLGVHDYNPQRHLAYRRAAAYLQGQVAFYTDFHSMLTVVQRSSSIAYVDGMMQARSACNADAVLDSWDATQVGAHVCSNGVY